jgi:hypothetical protein
MTDDMRRVSVAGVESAMSSDMVHSLPFTYAHEFDRSVVTERLGSVTGVCCSMSIRIAVRKRSEEHAPRLGFFSPRALLKGRPIRRRKVTDCATARLQRARARVLARDSRTTSSGWAAHSPQPRPPASPFPSPLPLQPDSPRPPPTRCPHYRARARASRCTTRLTRAPASCRVLEQSRFRSSPRLTFALPSTAPPTTPPWCARPPVGDEPHADPLFARARRPRLSDDSDVFTPERLPGSVSGCGGWVGGRMSPLAPARRHVAHANPLACAGFGSAPPSW